MKLLYRVWVAIAIFAWVTGAADVKERRPGSDAYLRSEILSYSRARGVFAGVSLEGSSLRPDKDGNEALYGQQMTARDIVAGPEEPTPPLAAQKSAALLERASPRRKG